MLTRLGDHDTLTTPAQGYAPRISIQPAAGPVSGAAGSFPKVVGMRTTDVRHAGLVIAAQGGDRQARDELISAYVPLVYNIVGRALRGRIGEPTGAQLPGPGVALSRRRDLHRRV
jgi:hypothetical protein